MQMKKEENQELVSLNSELSELHVQELEQRLETDPLAVGLLDITDVSDDVLLKQKSFCPELHCGIDF